MRILAILLSCLATINGYTQDQDEGSKQLEVVRTICTASKIENIDPKPAEYTKGHLLSLSIDELSETSLKLDLGLKVNQIQRFETYAIAINKVDGYIFHVADYYDGTYIVTCLDGPLLGYQVISVNGMVTADSSTVVWYKNYFVHRYATGNVLTYKRKQIIELF